MVHHEDARLVADGAAGTTLAVSRFKFTEAKAGTKLERSQARSKVRRW